MHPRLPLLLALSTLFVLMPTTAHADGSLSYRGITDMTFPVSPAAVWEPSSKDWETKDSISHYDASRGTKDGKPRKHQSIDLMVPYGTPVHAAMSGKITWMPDGASYGYMIRVAGDDGRIYDYVHLGRDDRPASEAYADGLSKGSYVKRGQLLGWAGCSGSASCTSTGYHLHFSVEDPSITDDPYFSDPAYYHYDNPRLDPFRGLRAALQRRDVGGEKVRPAGSFWDVSVVSTHGPNVEAILDAAFTRGCSKGHYCPAGQVTRAEMATFLARALELEPVVSTFADVPTGSTHAGAIGAIAEHGITNGCGDGNYCPDGPVTRAEMASFLARALELPSTEPSFDDVAARSTHGGAIGAIAEHGITNGCGDGKYCPADAVTRAEMASFLARAFLGA